ncbi:hypothetical protein CE91St62_21260 [Lachnospiraceae bacterium]|nr:hypothetical protein CE91St61_21360 [Lachnospiraceae bacterium]BDF38065.1 hypothetical protein CE91St62_21260 [Lachnospiraceae bacterium]
MIPPIKNNVRPAETAASPAAPVRAIPDMTAEDGMIPPSLRKQAPGSIPSLTGHVHGTSGHAAKPRRVGPSNAAIKRPHMLMPTDAPVPHKKLTHR